MSLQDLEESDGVATVLLTHLPVRQQFGVTPVNREADVWAFCQAHGCDINRQNRKGQTALHALVSQRFASPDMIGICLSLGIDPSLKDRNGRTALELAAVLEKKDLLPSLQEQI